MKFKYKKYFAQVYCFIGGGKASKKASETGECKDGATQKSVQFNKPNLTTREFYTFIWRTILLIVWPL